ncbi:MAG: hypothetical protein ABIH79_00240 [archaeon]
MLNKRGELTTKEILEIILGAAAFLLLAVLLYNLISPNFDKGEETAESYFGSFKEQIVVADSGGVGSFSIWSPEDKEEKRNFYLVYFGSSSSYGNELKFYSLGDNLNHLCLCSREKDGSECGYCNNLEYPVFAVGLSVDKDGRWAIGVGEKIEITKGDEVYEVRKV